MPDPIPRLETKSGLEAIRAIKHPTKIIPISGDPNDFNRFFPCPEYARTLPGSAIPVKDFLRYFHRDQSDADNQLLSESYPDRNRKSGPIFYHTEKGQNGNTFTLRVFGGSFNKAILAMSSIGNLALARGGFDKLPPGMVTTYTDSLRKIFTPIVNHVQAENYLGGIDIWEDCLATDASVSAVILTLLGNREDAVRRGVRINAAVATTHSLMLLRKLSEQYGFNVEINVGSLAYGLSEDPGGQHINYLVYPHDLKKQAIAKISWNFAGANYVNDFRTAVETYSNVVADMGEAMKRLAEGVQGEVDALLYDRNDHDKPILVFLKNGGYGIYALLKEIMGNNFSEWLGRYNVLALCASRSRYDGEYGVKMIVDEGNFPQVNG